MKKYENVEDGKISFLSPAKKMKYESKTDLRVPDLRAKKKEL